jgi:hypothetical protein
MEAEFIRIGNDTASLLFRMTPLLLVSSIGSLMWAPPCPVFVDDTGKLARSPRRRWKQGGYARKPYSTNPAFNKEDRRIEEALLRVSRGW